LLNAFNRSLLITVNFISPPLAFSEFGFWQEN
jgi:hypothetical protein